MSKDEAIHQAVEYTRRECPINDIGGRMILAAHAMDSINQRYPEEDKRRTEPDPP